MDMMREIEDRIERKLYRQGKILGGVYVGRGQEAIPVGSALLSTPEDILLPCHRDMATLLIAASPRDRSSRRYMADGGFTRGRDGNMHMGDLKLNVISIISALADRPGRSRVRAGAPAILGNRASVSPPAYSLPKAAACS